MGYYAVPGNQTTVTSSFKTAAQVNATGTTKRGKVYEIILGANSNPNATDTYLEWQLSRITATGAGAYTTWTPTLLDPADGAAVSVSGVNATAEATAITANSFLFWEGVNQRSAVRWVASQESQYFTFPATLSNGFVLRAQSSTFTTAITGQLSFQE